MCTQVLHLARIQSKNSPEKLAHEWIFALSLLQEPTVALEVFNTVIGDLKFDEYANVLKVQYIYARLTELFFFLEQNLFHPRLKTRDENGIHIWKTAAYIY